MLTDDAVKFIELFNEKVYSDLVLIVDGELTTVPVITSAFAWLSKEIKQNKNKKIFGKFGWSRLGSLFQNCFLSLSLPNLSALSFLLFVLIKSS